MPSTLVHLALAGLVAVALLGDEFTPRALGVALLATALIDADAFVGIVVPGAHRSLFHTLLLPVLVGGLLLVDGRDTSGNSFVRDRWGRHGVRVAWVTLAAVTFGGIFPDLFTNGVNAFYPLHDTFYSINGHFYLSNQRGIVQSFIDVAPAEPRQTSKTFHYSTGVDPTAGSESENVERLFPVVMAGWQLMLVAIGGFVTTARLWEFSRRE